MDGMPCGTLCQEAWSLPGSSLPETVYMFKPTLGRERPTEGLSCIRLRKFPELKTVYS